ncbi:hypothetical protein [Tenacibaculum sp. IB213877]|uniref:hypothetical protein n=1 Tax=Tenacibaculum sp. IB213877 TaxID=3097351 RepID=UPI002A5A0A8D|nr:hypothetical protein [Tenacibaculum sp. IB213877]MDY0779953.1 hypothetical protein [Tenacibaculum sp. IB213877]
MNAQVDASTGGNSKGPIIGVTKQPVKEITKPTSLDFGNNNGFKTAKKELDQKIKQQQEEEKLNNSGIITPEMIAQQKFNKDAEKFGYEIPMIDMDLGSFHTKSKNLNISSYDFGILDGDIISIYKNGNPLIENLNLKNTIQIVSIPLDIGFNKIEIKAIDEGRLRPNTGAFTVFDDFKEVVTSNTWFLAKGAKVIAIVIRDEE